MSTNIVDQLMRGLSLAGWGVRRRRSLTKQGRRPEAPNLVEADLAADAPDRVWGRGRHDDRQRDRAVACGHGA